MLVPTRDPIAYLFSLEQFGIKLGLKTIRKLVASLGSPERSWACTSPGTDDPGTGGEGERTPSALQAEQGGEAGIGAAGLAPERPVGAGRNRE